MATKAVNRRPRPLPALATDEATSSATNTGAMAFNPLTKRVPIIPMGVHVGAAKPRMAPIAKPTRIRITRLTLVYLRRTETAILMLFWIVETICKDTDIFPHDKKKNATSLSRALPRLPAQWPFCPFIVHMRIILLQYIPVLSPLFRPYLIYI